MGIRKKGRPRGDSFVINMICTKIVEYRRRGLTGWSAWNELCETDGFTELMWEWFKDKNKLVKDHSEREEKNTNQYVAFFSTSPRGKKIRDKFYVNNILKYAEGIQGNTKTNPKHYTNPSIRHLFKKKKINL
jgi:hypothetical protein|tara:strand:- start:749 stop:1144 length:396 start_codon:yes stop_codon:yes gene_type:complete